MVAASSRRERPDALLPTMGGQTGLNTALALAEDGTLERLGVELIGANGEAIDKAEDRQMFREAMDKHRTGMPASSGRPQLWRRPWKRWTVSAAGDHPPVFHPGRTGGGIAYNQRRIRRTVEAGLRASPATKCWSRNRCWAGKNTRWRSSATSADNCIIVCSIENIDPMGIHTGDSITVAPALTLTDKEYQIMRNASIACCARSGSIPAARTSSSRSARTTGRPGVIEMNPRVSRPRPWRRRRPAFRSPRSPRNWRSATRWTNSTTTSPR